VITLVETREDQIVWTLETSGVYTAQTAFMIQFKGQIRSNFPKLIWKVWATPKCKFFYLVTTARQALDIATPPIKSLAK
jgi:hypothetical protein